MQQEDELFSFCLAACCPWQSSQERQPLCRLLDTAQKRDEIDRVIGHHLVQVCKLELMRLGLHKENLFTLLLRRGYFHHSVEVATIKIAEKLYLTLHELVHQHESGLLGSTKPVDQLVAYYIGEPGDGLKVVADTFVEVCLHTVCIIWALLCDDAGSFGQAYILKALAYQVKQ